MRRGSWVALVLAAAVVLAGCGGADRGTRSDDGSSGDGGTADVVTLPNVEGDPHEDVPSALEDPRNPAFPTPLIDPADIISGGPPPDGIPAIDDPTFQRASDVDWLADDEPVLSLTVGDETRAYPIQVMLWHEIVNDTLDGVPMAVTYCPLCNSGVAFERDIGDRVLSFGTSGRLYANNLVMYDRQTESLWPQLTGTAAVGVLTGTELESVPMGAVPFGEFRQQHPQAWVLSRETGYVRDYGRNPYTGYGNAESDLLFPLPEEVDSRLPVKARVVGIGEGQDAVAVPRQLLAERGVMHLDVGGRDLVLWHRPGQVSALDQPSVAGGRDIGTVAVFEAGGRTFEIVDGEIRDKGTGSTWHISGEAIEGELTGETLTPVEYLDTFWFAWVTFQPETRLVN